MARQQTRCPQYNYIVPVQQTDTDGHDVRHYLLFIRLAQTRHPTLQHLIHV